jgi:aminoglycoside phosphotransferase (APT) family kinase protein
LLCEDPAVIGAPFYLMERRHGTVLRKAGSPDLAPDPDLADRLCRAMVDTLSALHRVDHRAIGLDGFGKPEGYVGRQVTGWAERYRAAETDPLPEMAAVADWLAATMPPERGVAVIHNDFKFDNVMLAADDPGTIAAVLDWEMATIGDPLMDLGMALAYWVEPTDPEPLRAVAMGPTLLPGMWSRERVVAAYAERAGIEVRDLTFYRVFGYFKLAVIGQQIYARYARGFTADERFVAMKPMVAVLAAEAARMTATRP